MHVLCKSPKSAWSFTFCAQASLIFAVATIRPCEIILNTFLYKDVNNFWFGCSCLSPIVSNCLSALFYLFTTFLVPLQLFIQIERKLYFLFVEPIFLEYVWVFIVRNLHLCGKINRKHTNKQSFEIRFYKQSRWYIYFMYMEWIFLSDLRGFIPNIAQYSFVRENKQTKNQTSA